jgi:hypothetical protein
VFERPSGQTTGVGSPFLFLVCSRRGNAVSCRIR